MAVAKKKNKIVFDPATYQYADCREQHIWQAYDGTLKPKLKIAYQVQRCSGCGMKRMRTLSTKAGEEGRVLSRTYKAPDGYYVPGGLDWRDLGQIRMRNFLASIGSE